MLMVRLASIILTVKPAAAENTGEGTLNSRNQGISLKKSVRNARGLKAWKGKAETLWSIDLQVPHQTQAKEEIFFVQLIFPGLKEIINLLKLQPNDEE